MSDKERDDTIAYCLHNFENAGHEELAGKMGVIVNQLIAELTAANERAEKALSKSEAQVKAAEDQQDMCYYCGRGVPGWHCHSCWKRVLEKLVRFNGQLTARDEEIERLAAGVLKLIRHIEWADDRCDGGKLDPGFSQNDWIDELRTAAEAAKKEPK